MSVRVRPRPRPTAAPARCVAGEGGRAEGGNQGLPVAAPEGKSVPGTPPNGKNGSKGPSIWSCWPIRSTGRARRHAGRSAARGRGRQGARARWGQLIAALVGQRGATRRQPAVNGAGTAAITRTRAHERQPGRFPCREPAGDLADVGEAVLLQQAGRDRRAVAAGAVDQQRAILRQLGEPRRSWLSGMLTLPPMRFCVALARRPHVDDQRRRADGEPFGGERCAEALGRRPSGRARSRRGQPSCR